MPRRATLECKVQEPVTVTVVLTGARHARPLLTKRAKCAHHAQVRKADVLDEAWEVEVTKGVFQVHHAPGLGAWRFEPKYK